MITDTPKTPKTCHPCVWRYGLAVLTFLFLAVWTETGAAFEGTRMAVVVSQKIRPYIRVADGILQALETARLSADLIFLSKGVNGDDVIRDLADMEMVAAVGPEAATLVYGSGIGGHKLYAAVLDPHQLQEIPEQACGISLRIPVSEQLGAIARAFPSFKRIGLLFDPAHNQAFYNSAVSQAAAFQLDIVPIQVTSREKINAVLKARYQVIDAIWMIPDRTIISEKIIHYVIKQGLYQGIGVIGYNSFFTRSGAVFSFEFNYLDLGVQAGQKMLEWLSSQTCSSASPVFNTLVNQGVAEKIAIRVAP